MKKLFTVLLLCFSLLATAQKVMEFEYAETFRDGERDRITEEVKTVVIAYPEKVQVIMKDKGYEFTFSSDFEKLFLRGKNWFAVEVTNKGNLYLLFIEDNGEAVIIMDKKDDGIIFYR